MSFINVQNIQCEISVPKKLVCSSFSNGGIAKPVHAGTRRSFDNVISVWARHEQAHAPVLPGVFSVVGCWFSSPANIGYNVTLPFRSFFR
jgi:hypothetical protein